jgi:YD repeat-containing protein
MEDLVRGEEVTYAYDELGRLVRAETTGPQWGMTFTYDGFGNRVTQDATKGTVNESELLFDASKNRIVPDGINQVQYDVNGNMTRMVLAGCGTATLTYDGLNRVSYVNAGTCGKEWYGYGPDGRRVWKKTQLPGQTLSEATEVYLWVGWGAAGGVHAGCECESDHV